MRKRICFTLLLVYCCIVCIGQIRINGMNYAIVQLPNKQSGGIINYASLEKVPNTVSGNFTIPSTISYRGKTLEVKYIGDGAFRNCDKITAINFSNVSYIGNSAFRNCTSLSKISFSNNIKRIGMYAFEGCSGLKSISFPPRMERTQIEEGAFMNCSSLVSVDFPRLSGGFFDTEICSDMFNGCSSLTTVRIPSNIKTIRQRVFANCTSLTDIYFSSKELTYLDRLNVFEGVLLYKINIHVTKEALEVYKANSTWSELLKQFNRIDTNLALPSRQKKN